VVILILAHQCDGLLPCAAWGRDLDYLWRA